MNSFIFRNNTIENIFGNKDIAYSGYDDVSYVPQDASQYIWFYQVPYKFDRNLLAREVESYIDKFELVLSKIPSNRNLLVFTLIDLYPIHYIDNDLSLNQAVTDFNSFIISKSQEYKNIKIINTKEFFDGVDQNQWIDWKFYFISQMAINPKLALKFKKWYQTKVNQIALKRKKCLVLDLDNTLWGGVLGEDGIDGIKIGGDYPGKAFLYFQEALLELSKTGVILTVCSKNNENDVIDAWNKNPFIVLTQKHFSAQRINWHNKADNIKELADELNIGLDSMVFLDDNPTERELVKQLLPMVEVPHFPEQPYELPQFFNELVNKYFRVYAVTNEDKKKTEQYKANAQRSQEQKKFTDFSEYLKSLEIEIKIQSLNEYNLERIAQMTQKTNQFNLTTKRYTDSDIKYFKENGNLIYCISVSDKFGDNGITGEIIINLNGKEANIDTFLLSCRILGKGIEEAFINTILHILQEQGVNSVKAQYVPTLKNVQVKDFYERVGFSLVKEKEGVKDYRIELLNKKLEVKPLYKIVIE